jgi:nucleotide-binding universal stress UspA family protein
MDFNLILCAVDFSDTSDCAFDYSVELARKLGAQIKVVHVFQIPAAAMPDGVMESPVDYENIMQDQLQERIDKYVADKAVEGIEIATGVCEGIPYIEINEAASEVNADMIVIGTHGRTGLPHMLMGSVAERVVRTAEVPVISIRKI